MVHDAGSWSSCLKEAPLTPTPDLVILADAWQNAGKLDVCRIVTRRKKERRVLLDGYAVHWI